MPKPRDIASLSPRQFEIFKLIGQGLDHHEIAAKLGISNKTVDAHRMNIRYILGAGSSREVMRQAVIFMAKEEK